MLAALMLAPLPASADDPCADRVPQPRPQKPGRDIVGQDIDAILGRGFMTVALYADYAPSSSKVGGTPRGIDVEVARIIAEYIGVEPRFRFVAAGENLDADLRNAIRRGPVVVGRVSNVMRRVPYDRAFKCRAEQIVFPGQDREERVAIAYREAAYPDGGPVPAYFRMDTVAVENDPFPDTCLMSFAGGQTAADMRRYPSMRAAMAVLNAGDTKAAMGPRTQLEHFAGDGVVVHEPPPAGVAKSSRVLGAAVHDAYRPLSYTVEAAVFEALKDGRIAGIMIAYGATHHPPRW